MRPAFYTYPERKELRKVIKLDSVKICFATDVRNLQPSRMTFHLFPDDFWILKEKQESCLYINCYVPQTIHGFREKTGNAIWLEASGVAGFVNSFLGIYDVAFAFPFWPFSFQLTNFLSNEFLWNQLLITSFELEIKINPIYPMPRKSNCLTISEN